MLIDNDMLYYQSCGFSSSCEQMWELDHKESWVPKNQCFQIVVLEKTLERTLVFKGIKPVNLKWNQLWVFIGRLMLKLKVQYFGHLIWRANSLEKTLMLEKIEGRRIRGWQRMRWLDSIIDSWTWIGQTPGDSEGQGSLVCWVRRVMKSWTGLSNWTTIQEEELVFVGFQP